MKTELSRLFKITNNLIKKDYCNHRNNIITKNIDKFKSTKRAFKKLIIHKKWIHNLNHVSEGTTTRKSVTEHATNFYRNLYKKQDYDIIENQIKNNTVFPIDERVHTHEIVKKRKMPWPI